MRRRFSSATIVRNGMLPLGEFDVDTLVLYPWLAGFKIVSQRVV